MTAQATLPDPGDALAIDTPPPEPPVPALRLVLTLGIAGALAGLLLVVVFRITQPAIQAHKARVLKEAVLEVLKSPDRYDTLYVIDGALVAEPPAGADPADFERVFAGYRDGEGRVGYAIAAGEPGFQDVIRLIFGYDPETRRVLGMKVLESKETPGLGDKIEKDTAFTGQFDGRILPLLGVKNGAASGPGDVDMITGATISSRTVIRIINNAVERLQPALAGHGGGE